jgi:uncharacterized protein YjbJ (UPF0337 family)
MTDRGQAGQARETLLDSAKGKAKEIVGAVTGNDSLTAEGQLQQTEAKERRAASASHAEAEAEAKEAEALANDAKIEGATQRLEVGAKAAAAENAVRSEQLDQKQTVESAGKQDVARAQAKVELQAQQEAAQAKAEERAEINSVAKEYAEAVDEHRHELNEFVRTKAEANRMRLRAETDADLP